MTKWTTENGVTWTKYKEKENLVMRINEITNSTEKLELLRMIDAAIWHAFDAESAYGDYDEINAEQGVTAAPVNANQVAPKPAAIQKPTTPVKKLTQQQQAHVKTLGPKELLHYIKTNLKAPTANAPKPAIQANPTPATNNSSTPNTSFDTVNSRNDTAKNKDGESDRQV
jgi:glycerophosphoryl diester phosphodiesterase